MLTTLENQHFILFVTDKNLIAEQYTQYMMIFRYGLAWFFFIILITLQWPLWFAKGSTVAVWENEEQRNILQKNNHQLSIRNQALSAEIQDLKHGHDAIEERARYQLGMIKPKEKFYQVTP